MRMLLPALLALLASPLQAQMAGPEDTVRVIRQVPLGNGRVRESSGLVASRRTPGVLWTINDSGNSPDLFATDTLGRDLGTWRVAGAANQDWEALAAGRCGVRWCLYVADVGDNALRRRSVRIYRVPEPELPPAAGRATVPVLDSIVFTYEDGPRNVEAIFLDGDTIYLLSKERSGGSRVYRLDAERREWASVARFVQELPLPDGLGFQVTDAALAVNGADVAIRTYRYIYFLRLEDGMLAPDPRRSRCDAGGLDAQGEGITWLSPRRLATTSERVLTLGGTVAVVECR